MIAYAVYKRMYVHPSGGWRGTAWAIHCWRNTLLTASQGEQGNLFDSKLGLGLRKRTEMKSLSPEKPSSHLVESKVKINELVC